MAHGLLTQAREEPIMDRELSRKTRWQLLLRRWIPGVGVALAAGGGLVWAIGWLEPTLERRDLRTGRVERGDVESVITGSGTVRPAAEQVVSSPIEARVIRVLEQPGALLEPGDPILELDVGASRLGLAQLDGEQRQNAARRQELELELEEAVLDLSSRREIKALDVEELEHLEGQRRELFGQGLVAESALRQVETQVRRARIELRALGDAIAKRRQVAGSRLASLEAERLTLEQERQQALELLRRATTRAERAGVLTTVEVAEGETVLRGQVLARVADLDRFRVESVVSDVHAERLELGQTVRVPIAEAALLDGRVERILPGVEAGTLRFWVELEEPAHPQLRDGRRTDVLVVTGSKPGVLTLAKGAQAGGSGERRVFVVEGDSAERRSVRFGLTGYERLEVLEGLAEGDEVILSDLTDYLHLERVGLR